MKTKLGIVGLGYVGGSVHRWFELPENQEKAELYLYDKFKEMGSIDEVNKADIIFVAVPTPYYDNSSACHELHLDYPQGEKKTGYDDSAVWEVVSDIEGGKVVVIKSSVLPGTTEEIQKKYPDKIILFSPEFLTEKNAFQDFIKPDRQIIGFADDGGKEVAEKVMSFLPDAPFKKIIRAREAEMVKFFGNTYLASRVVFANQIYDLCEKMGIDYDLVRESVGSDVRIGHSHFDVLHGGFRGYGGSCFPKDMKALIDFAKEKGVKLELLREIDDINERLRKSN